MIELKQIENRLIKDTNFLVVDVETTGLSADGDRITEIALVNVNNGRITNEFSTLINPHQFIPRFITELTGITNEMVSDKPDFEKSLPAIKNFIGEKRSVPRVIVIGKWRGLNKTDMVKAAHEPCFLTHSIAPLEK